MPLSCSVTLLFETGNVEPDPVGEYVLSRPGVVDADRSLCESSVACVFSGCDIAAPGKVICGSSGSEGTACLCLCWNQVASCSLVRRGRCFHSSCLSPLESSRDALSEERSLNLMLLWSSIASRAVYRAASVSCNRFSSVLMYATGRPRLPPS
jgi:hypothetical protein